MSWLEAHLGWLCFGFVYVWLAIGAAVATWTITKDRWTTAGMFLFWPVACMYFGVLLIAGWIAAWWIK